MWNDVPVTVTIRIIHVNTGKVAEKEESAEKRTVDILQALPVSSVNGYVTVIVSISRKRYV